MNSSCPHGRGLQVNKPVWVNVQPAGRPLAAYNDHPVAMINTYRAALEEL